MKIIFSGGGTLGPVTPLLAMVEMYRRHDDTASFVWVGSVNGPEREVVEEYDLPFFSISSGKWRRYWSLQNLLDILKIGVGFFQSLVLLWQEKPDLLISAGGFISVPLHWAGFCLGIPSWIHQQDVRVGLATKLMAPCAKKITTALAETAAFFSPHKTEWIGNPCRDVACADLSGAREFFSIPPNSPVIFALGGGTGSSAINQLIIEALTSWPANWHVIHLTGKERPGELAERASKTFSNYHVYKFFTNEMKLAYALADVVVSRAGFGTLTELATLSKAAIIFPLPRTHQEENADFLAAQNGIIHLQEGVSNSFRLTYVVRDLIEHPDKRQNLGKNLHTLLPSAPAEKIIGIVRELTF